MYPGLHWSKTQMWPTRVNYQGKKKIKTVHTSFSAHQSFWTSSARQNSVPNVISITKRNWWQNRVHLWYKPICLHTTQHPFTCNNVRTNDLIFFLGGCHLNLASTISNPFMIFSLETHSYSYIWMFLPSQHDFLWVVSLVLMSYIVNSSSCYLVFSLWVRWEKPLKGFFNVDLTL